MKVGFRPEHFAELGDAPQGAHSCRSTCPVQFVEKVGPDAIAFLSLPEQTIAVRVDSPCREPLPARRNAPRCCLPLGKINVFDADTGFECE